jgi:hypothetical protein
MTGCRLNMRGADRTRGDQGSLNIPRIESPSAVLELDFALSQPCVETQMFGVVANNPSSVVPESVADHQKVRSRRQRTKEGEGIGR